MKKQFTSVKGCEPPTVLNNVSNYSTVNYPDSSKPLMFKKTESNTSMTPKQGSSNKNMLPADT